MEGVFFDQYYSMNLRSSFSGAVAANNHSNLMLHGSYFSPSIVFGNEVGLFGSRPLPTLYSSLPSFTVTPPPSRQPPLPPLPFSKPTTLPSPTPSKRITSVRSRQHKNKPRPSIASSRKEDRSPGTARSDPKLVEKPTIALKLEDAGEDKEKEIFLPGSLYSISPPPSSLPLPKFSLTRCKTTTVSSNVEAAGRSFGGGGARGGDAGSHG